MTLAIAFLGWQGAISWFWIFAVLGLGISILAYGSATLQSNFFTPTFSKLKEHNELILTFDDGPDTKKTPKILESLKRQNVPATFFISTHQLEDRAGKKKRDVKKKGELLLEMLKNGFTIASHGHDHDCHDLRLADKKWQAGFNDEQRREQVKMSIDLLNKYTNNKFSKQNLNLIRFPYGRGISPSKIEIAEMEKRGRHFDGDSYAQKLKSYRETSPAMSVASEYNLSHIGWNMDSQDASSKYSSTNQETYVHDQLKNICGSSANKIMTLFHDTRSINSLPSVHKGKTVIEEIIEKSKCLGVKFLSMKQILDQKLQTGVYIKADPLKLKSFTSTIKKINEDSPKACIISPEEVSQPMGESCYSNDLQRDVPHCQGSSSFCIDGKWITNKNVYELICMKNMSVDNGKLLLAKYLWKSCSIKSKRVEIEKNKVACYCQYDDNSKLFWNCFDISNTKAEKITK